MRRLLVLLSFISSLSLFGQENSGMEGLPKSQDIPGVWTIGESSFPTPDWAKLPGVQPAESSAAVVDADEAKLWQKIQDTWPEAATHALALEYLSKYPNSKMRYTIFAMLNRLTNKYLQLYCKNNWLSPQQIPTIVIAGLGLEKVELRLYQVQLEKQIQAKQDIRLLPPDHELQLLQTWQIPIQDQSHSFLVNFDLPKLNPGIYKLTGQSREIQSDLGIIVSNLRILTKQSKDMLFLWVGNSDGSVLEEPACLQFIYHQQVLGSSKTNLAGIWCAAISGIFPITIVARYRDHWAIAETTWYQYEGALDYGYIFLDRPFYRPGYKIRAKIFLRELEPDTGNYTWQPKSPIHVGIQDPKWKMLLDTQAELTGFGTMSLEYTLPSDAVPGRYCLRVRGWCMVEQYFQVVSSQQETLEFTKEQTQRTMPACSSIKLKKAQYEIGDQAEFNIQQTQPGPLLVTYEAFHLLGYRVVQTPSAEWNQTLLPCFAPQFKIAAHKFQAQQMQTETTMVMVKPTHQILPLVLKKIETQRKGPDQRQAEIYLDCMSEHAIQQPGEIMISAIPQREGSKSQVPQVSIEEFFYAQRNAELPCSDSYQFDFYSNRNFSTMSAAWHEKTEPVPTITTSQWILQTYDFPDAESAWNAHIRYIQCPLMITLALPAHISQWKITIIGIDQSTRVSHIEAELQCGD